jgi:hypothetical protein
MLKNDPPSGTPIRFLTEIRKAARDSIGKLVRPRRTYLTETADDEFEVDFGGERYIVRRRDIEEATQSSRG